MTQNTPFVNTFSLFFALSFAIVLIAEKTLSNFQNTLALLTQMWYDINVCLRKNKKSTAKRKKGKKGNHE